MLQTMTRSGPGEAAHRHREDRDAQRWRAEPAGAATDVFRDGEGRIEPDHDDQGDPAGHHAHVPVDQVVEGPAGRHADDAAHGPLERVEEKDQHAAQPEEGGERDDERGQMEPGDEEALHRPDDTTGQKSHDHRGPPGPAIGGREQGHGDGGADTGHIAHREVDLAQNEGKGLAQSEQDEERGLDEQVDDVAGRQEFRRLRLEDDDDDDEAEQDRQRAAFPAADSPHPGVDVLTERIGQEVGGDGDEVDGWVRGGAVHDVRRHTRARGGLRFRRRSRRGCRWGWRIVHVSSWSSWVSVHRRPRW